ncbi:MAG TPA: efflux RND transporter periplasmic adaptor subunit [Opitutaceae bacterium]
MPFNREKLDQLKLDRPVAKPRTSGAPWLVALTFLAVIAGIAWWWWNRPQTVVVETAQARVLSDGRTTTLLNASGYVTARRAATVSSKVTGRVVDVLIEEGMEVAEGQVLAHVDASNVETNLRLAEAQLQSARAALGETEAALVLAQSTLDRTNRLAEARVVSAADIDSAQAGVDTLLARLERQRAEIAVAGRQVALWKQQLDDTIIRAPFAGVVISKNAQPGEMISPISAGGGFTRTGICTIVDMSSLEIEVDVNESYINRVSAGQPVVATLDSYPGWRIPAKVIAIIPTADRQKASVRVRVGFDELDPRILPDMSLKVAFQSTAGEEQPAMLSVVVPKAAIKRDNGRDVVWVVENNLAERRAVTIASSNNNEIILAAGLQGGETIVVNAPDSLTDGARVKEKTE